MRSSMRAFWNFRVAALVVAIAATAPHLLAAPPAPQPPTGTIAFVCHGSGANNEICTVPAGAIDAVNPTNLTQNGGSDSSPGWSPDGTRIAFSTQRDNPGAGIYQIYLMDQNGANQTRFTHSDVSEFDATWSPDGTKVAFSRDSGGGKLAVIARTIASGLEQSITTGAFYDDDPAWLPDGQRIAFVRDGSLWIADVGGAQSVQGPVITDILIYAPANGVMAISPDGSKVAFTRGSDLWTANIDGTNQRQITVHPGSAIDAEPDWSPDGRWIAFSRNTDATIYLVDSEDPGNVRTLTSSFYAARPKWQRIPPPLPTAAIQPPINANGSSVFNAKRGVVPVKFTVSINGSATCQLPPATISLVRTAGGTLGAVNVSDFIQPSDVGSTFRVSGCQYIYNLGSSGLGVGTYVVQINIKNVAVGSVTFSLK